MGIESSNTTIPVWVFQALVTFMCPHLRIMCSSMQFVLHAMVFKRQTWVGACSGDGKKLPYDQLFLQSGPRIWFCLETNPAAYTDKFSQPKRRCFFVLFTVFPSKSSHHTQARRLFSECATKSHISSCLYVKRSIKLYSFLFPRQKVNLFSPFAQRPFVTHFAWFLSPRFCFPACCTQTENWVRNLARST